MRPLQMKNIINLFLLLCTVIGTCQSPELVVNSNGDEYGELEIVGDFLYRGGLDHEIARTDISTDTFTTELIATGTASEISLRMAVSDDGTEVFLNEFGSKIRSATITSGVSTLQDLLEEDIEVVGMDYHEGQLYFTTTAPQILRLDPINPESSLSLIYDPASVLPIYNTHIADGFLYYSTQDSFNEPITYEIFRLDLSENEPAPEFITTTPERIWSITTVGDFLYLLSDSNVTVYRTTISNPQNEAPLYLEVPVSNTQDVFSIAHDGDFLYYSALGGAGGIYRITDEVLGLDVPQDIAVQVYPVPAQQWLTISGIEVTQNRSFMIINMLGQVVVNDILTANSRQINISQLATGAYYFKIEGQEALRFLKN